MLYKYSNPVAEVSPERLNMCSGGTSPSHVQAIQLKVSPYWMNIWFPAHWSFITTQIKPTDLHNERDTNQETNKTKQSTPQILNPQRHSTRFTNPDAIRNFLHVGPEWVKTNLFYGSIIMSNYLQNSVKKLNKLTPLES